MRCQRLWAVAVWMATFAAVAMADVTASLDRDHIGAGESVQLTLQHDGRSGGEPDLAPLAQDFDVVGRSSGSSVQIVNGQVSAQRQLQLTLVPKHSGRLTVPALAWDGERSPPLSLVVGGTPGGAGDSASGGPAAPAFITTALEPPRPYVQASSVLTVRVHARQTLYQASLDLPGNDDVRVQQLGKDREDTEMRDGQSYRIIERKYALFPQRSGTLHLDGPVLDAQVAARNDIDPIFGQFRLPGFTGATRPLRLHADPVVLEVRPRPAGLGAGGWLPAQQLTLTETWKPPSGPIHVGEPLTRHLSLSAVGASAEQLPDLGAALVLPQGVRAYPDQARLDTVERAGSVVGRREQDIAMIASRSGPLTLPALHLSWWDTTRDVAQDAVLPARTIEVLPAVGTSPAPAPFPAQVPAVQQLASAPASSAPPALPPPTALTLSAPSTRWPWISLGLAALWLGTLACWWWDRRKRHAPTPAPAAPVASPALGPGHAAAARRAVLQACRANTPNEARQALLAWARLEWPQVAPDGLRALGSQLGDPQFVAQLRNLDRACFSKHPWSGAALSALIEALPSKAAATTRRVDPLGQLYA